MSKAVAITERPAGVHHCGPCNVAFNTDAEILKHKQDFEHEFTGYAPCKDCKIPNIPYKKKLKLTGTMTVNDTPVYCNDCLLRLKAEIAVVEAQGKKN